MRIRYQLIRLCLKAGAADKIWLYNICGWCYDERSKGVDNYEWTDNYHNDGEGGNDKKVVDADLIAGERIFLMCLGIWIQ